MDSLREIVLSLSSGVNASEVIDASSNQSFSYRSLALEHERIATVIRGLSQQSNLKFGIYLEKKWTCLSYIGAVIRTQNICIPLDYSIPVNRLVSIINSNQLDYLVIEKNTYTALGAQLPDHSRIALGEETVLAFGYPDGNMVSSDKLAYILNTSGSTGIPKGVMITDENVLSFVNWAITEFELGPQDRVASLAPFHFDLSLFDLYVSLNSQASVVLYDTKAVKNPRLLAKRIAEDKISTLYTTPSSLQSLLHYGKLERYDYSALRYVLFAGEIFPIADLKKLIDIWTTATFYNLYGPTETNVCTYYRIPDHIDKVMQPFPIGKPCIPGTVKLSEEGELWVKGPAVSLGYLNNPEKTAAQFITDENNCRWYKTGDLASLDESGNYVFQGRTDRMVKRRGYRIELDDIEQQVNKLDEVESCAVIDITKAAHLSIICFYVLKKSAAVNADFVTRIREKLLEFLPVYMLPDRFVPLSQLPLNATLKTDYKGLKTLLIGDQD